MHDKANDGCSKRSNHAQDVRDQAVVLTFVLTLNGDYLTTPNLAKTLNEQPRDFKRLHRRAGGAGPDRRRLGRDRLGPRSTHVGGAAVHRDHRKRRLVKALPSEPDWRPD